MRFRVSSFFAAAFIASAAYGFEIGVPKLTLSSETPKPGDPMHVTIRGTWSDGCAPTTLRVVIEGQTINLETDTGACPRVCTPNTPSYELSADFVAPQSPGTYTIEYYATDCVPRRWHLVTKQFTVRDACDFAHSLAADAARLTWCDPSYFLGTDAAFQITKYLVYSAASTDGPFTRVAEARGTQYESAPGSYYFVEAHGCLVTIAGNQCTRTGRDTTLISNIVNVKSCANALCLLNDRFVVTATPSIGIAQAESLTDRSGYFWFFSPDNIEVTVKVIDACPTAYWVFASGMTNLGVELRVKDAKSGVARVYTNPPGTPFATILDTNAFSCP